MIQERSNLASVSIEALHRTEQYAIKTGLFLVPPYTICKLQVFLRQQNIFSSYHSCYSKKKHSLFNAINWEKKEAH